MDMHAINNYREEFAKAAPQLPGANVAWLRETRLAALEQFEATGFPGTRLEDWKYTNVGALTRRSFRFTPPVQPATPALLALPWSGTGDCLVFLNGHYSHALSQRMPRAKGIVASRMADALTTHRCHLQDMLAAEATNGFASLNAAFWTDGGYIAVADGVQIETPIHLVFLCTDPNQACNLRNVIHVGDGARLTVIEHYLGAHDDAYFTNAITHIDCGKDAGLTHYKLQEESPHAFHIGTVEVRQDSGSRFSSASFAFGAGLSRTEISTVFCGETCHAALDGLYLVGGKQHVDHHTCIDHRFPRGTSREHYKGVLDGAARGVFNGKIIVRDKAQRSDAVQANHNLLLSGQAEIDTKPQLEIFADDVQCRHGATVGQLDESQLFYLRSRGLDEDAARHALIHAFAADLVERVELPTLRAHLNDSLRRQVPPGVMA